MKARRLLLVIILSALILAGAESSVVRAGSDVRIAVKTILASQDSDFVEPRLSSLIHELKSVFKYSSYRLLSENNMTLKLKKTGRAALPGERVLKIRPVKIDGNRVTLQLSILKKGRQIFQTVVQLLNNSSITVGGPTYKSGYLLFNISSSF